MIFVKKQFSNDTLPMWYMYDEKTSKNNATLYYGNDNYMGIDIENLEKVESDSWFDLDFSNTKILSNTYKTGWVSPDGVFYGCDYKSHKYQAKLIHKKEERDMEDEGYIKITYDYTKDGQDYYVVYVDRKPTFKQISWFMCNYYELNRDDVIGLINYARMVLPNPKISQNSNENSPII